MTPWCGTEVTQSGVDGEENCRKLFKNKKLPEWRNWQTRWIQNPVSFTDVRVRVPPLVLYKKGVFWTPPSNPFKLHRISHTLSRQILLLVLLRYLNHTQAFWNQVDKVLSDYRDRKEWLRLNGAGMNL